MFYQSLRPKIIGEKEKSMLDRVRGGERPAYIAQGAFLLSGSRKT